MDLLTPLIKSKPHLKFVHINEPAVDELVELISKQPKQFTPFQLFEKEFSLEDTLQLIFIFNTQTFCFWSEKDKPKWTINDGKKSYDGSIALVKCLEKELANNPQLLEPEYLERLTLSQAEEIFKGNVEIPLLKDRLSCLNEAGRVLSKEFGGKFINIVEESNYDAIKLLELITQHFLYFNDTGTYQGIDVFFHKRAQLQVAMTNTVLSHFNLRKLDNLELLTGCADYKIPQILRHLKITEYSQELQNAVDNYEIIQKDSRQELEIRISMLLVLNSLCEKLKKKNVFLLPTQLDSVLWNMSQNVENIKPYHRTYTIAY